MVELAQHAVEFVVPRTVARECSLDISKYWLSLHVAIISRLRERTVYALFIWSIIAMSLPCPAVQVL